MRKLSELNRARKKVGNVMAGIGLCTYVAVILVLVIIQFSLLGLDAAWSLGGLQSWGASVWIDSANWEIRQGSLQFLIWTFGVGVMLFLTGQVVSVGKVEQ